MTEFPFHTRGPRDDEPIIKYNKEKFIHVFNAFLNQWNGQELDGRTELYDVSKIVTPNKIILKRTWLELVTLCSIKMQKAGSLF
ncbi:MAG: hypothetical protein M3139_15585 [Bacteroidota bacterium]|nr:hypothetical protein [Bacteroidota bacterium]